MADVLFITILVAFFGLCVGFVRICDRVIGADDQVVSPIAPADTEEALAA